MTRRSLRQAGSRGQTLVEFSLSALMLVVLMFGVFEMSRMLLVYTTVANAARAGVRYGIVHGADVNTATAETTQIQTLVKGYLSAAPINTANPGLTINVSYPGGGACPPVVHTNVKGCLVSVTVTYPYDPFVLFYSRFFSINISSTTEGIITW